ncbi:TetR/AcrR family transcriptional regulator [Streptomyces phaeofaciens]|uniref:TetR/AcrR family transcriptional regulator n=1 Tax=Streptomyces phaeofaciens TaxID=68254 RepID=UPI0036BC7A81
MEIARAAAGLFVSHGLKATRAEDIAHAAGIAPRTFYRYFATKEEAVAPLYSAGAQRWAQAVREAPVGLPVPEALEHAVRHTLVPGRAVSAASWEWVRTLIRLAGASPALGKVWAEVCHTSEVALAEVLVERAAAEREASEDEGSEDGASEGGASEDGASGKPASQDVGTRIRPERIGSERVGPERIGSERTGQARIGPHQLFTAAVVSAAVRVAVESWAATDTPPTGPEGPAELALRNLRALRGFAWGEHEPTDGS